MVERGGLENRCALCVPGVRIPPPPPISKPLILRMGATHFLMTRLKSVKTETALAVLAYNLTRVMNIIGIKPPIAAIREALRPISSNHALMTAWTAPTARGRPICIELRKFWLTNKPAALLRP